MLGLVLKRYSYPVLFFMVRSITIIASTMALMMCGFLLFFVLAAGGIERFWLQQATAESYQYYRQKNQPEGTVAVCELHDLTPAGQAPPEFPLLACKYKWQPVAVWAHETARQTMMILLFFFAMSIMAWSLYAPSLFRRTRELVAERKARSRWDFRKLAQVKVNAMVAAKPLEATLETHGGFIDYSTYRDGLRVFIRASEVWALAMTRVLAKDAATQAKYYWTMTARYDNDELLWTLHCADARLLADDPELDCDKPDLLASFKRLAAALNDELLAVDPTRQNQAPTASITG